MVKSYRYQEIQPSLGCPEIRGSIAHPRALVGTIQASSWNRMMNLRPLLECNWGQYFTITTSDVWSETIHKLARKATHTSMPSKIRLSRRLASYLRARFKHLLDVVWWIWDHFWHVIEGSTLHFRPQMFDQKRYAHWREKQPSLGCRERWGCHTG
jgi:hypothetical protein